MSSNGPLQGLRVLEHCGWNGVFAGRLLAEAGADVVRIVGPGPDPLAGEPPFFGDTQVSVQETWYNGGKRIVTVSSDAELKATLGELALDSDVLLEDWRRGDSLVAAGDLTSGNPCLVHVSISNFGADGPWAGYVSNDLVANALSGSASVTGNAETPPINGYGNQTYHTVGFYAAVCALAGLRAARMTGQPQHVEVNAHEALASCTEQVMMEWFFPTGAWNTSIAPRQGSLHWTGAYEVYPSASGRGIMVTVALRLFDSLLPWLEEEGAAQELSNREKYPDPVAMIRDLPYLMRVMRDWVATKDADEMFFEAQRRHQPFGVVWDIETAVQSPQAEARRYFQPHDVPGHGEVTFPGHILRTDADAPGTLGAPVQVSVRDLGWERSDRRAAKTERLPADKPLAGVRVMDFTHVLAGPFGTRVLGDLGADVIKIGTAARGAGANTPAHPYYMSWNRNKRSMTLNMGGAAGLRVARDLAARSDVIIENFRAGVLAKWGLDRPSLAPECPGVSVITMGGMGQTGPWKDFVTFAPTIHALAGLTYLTNPAGRHDLGYGFSLTDHLSGLAGALAACEALEHRARTGEGLAVDLSQYELGLSIMAPAYLDFFANGRNPEPVGNRHPFDAWAPHGIYRCAGDDAWVAIAVRGDDQWRALASLIGGDTLAEGRRFTTHDARIEHHDALDAVIEAWTCGLDRYDVMERCQGVGIPAGAVQNAADMNERDPQLMGAGFFGNAQSETWGEYGLDRFPARFDGARRMDYEGVHEVGQDTFDVLTDVLGYDAEQIAELAAEGALA